MNDRDTACARVRGRLDRWADGGLKALDAARDEGHLEACGACTDEAQRRERALDELRRALLPGDGALARASQGLEARLRAARAPGGGSSGPGRVLEGPWRRPLRAAAVAASALLALGFLDRLVGADIAGGVLGARRAAVAAIPDSVWPAGLDPFGGGR